MVAIAHSLEHQALIGLCGFAGLRVEEARTIPTSKVDLDDLLLHVLGKGDKERSVPISEECLHSIVGVLAFKQGGYPLVGLSDSAARHAISVIGYRALGHPVASHDLRMTFGTEVNDRFGVRIAQELLGHASVNTTEGYTKVTLDSMRAAVELR